MITNKSLKNVIESMDRELKYYNEEVKKDWQKRDFRKYEVWQLSRKFCLNIYSKTKSFPQEEMYGITSQIRRVAVSIPTNISEGCGRNSDKEYVHFINIALGFLGILAVIIIIFAGFKWMTASGNEDQVADAKKMLTQAVIGLAIIFLAYIIVKFVTGQLADATA